MSRSAKGTHLSRAALGDPPGRHGRAARTRNSTGSSEACDDALPSFVSTLWGLVNNPANSNSICWSEDGADVVLKDDAGQLSTLLKNTFSHSNHNSFNRQLNFYNFKRHDGDDSAGSSSDEGEGGGMATHLLEKIALKGVRQAVKYRHKYFSRDHPELLRKVIRKTNHRALRELAEAHQAQQARTAARGEQGASVPLPQKQSSQGPAGAGVRGSSQHWHSVEDAYMTGAAAGFEPHSAESCWSRPGGPVGARAHLGGVGTSVLPSTSANMHAESASQSSAGRAASSAASLVGVLVPALGMALSQASSIGDGRSWMSLQAHGRVHGNQQGAAGAGSSAASRKRKSSEAGFDAVFPLTISSDNDVGSGVEVEPNSHSKSGPPQQVLQRVPSFLAKVQEEDATVHASSSTHAHVHTYEKPIVGFAPITPTGPAARATLTPVRRLEVDADFYDAGQEPRISSDQKGPHSLHQWPAGQSSAQGVGYYDEEDGQDDVEEDEKVDQAEQHSSDEEEVDDDTAIPFPFKKQLHLYECSDASEQEKCDHEDSSVSSTRAGGHAVESSPPTEVDAARCMHELLSSTGPVLGAPVEDAREHSDRYAGMDNGLMLGLLPLPARILPLPGGSLLLTNTATGETFKYEMAGMPQIPESVDSHHESTALSFGQATPLAQSGRNKSHGQMGTTLRVQTHADAPLEYSLTTPSGRTGAGGYYSSTPMSALSPHLHNHEPSLAHLTRESADSMRAVLSQLGLESNGARTTPFVLLSPAGMTRRGSSMLDPARGQVRVPLGAVVPQRDDQSDGGSPQGMRAQGQALEGRRSTLSNSNGNGTGTRVVAHAPTEPEAVPLHPQAFSTPQAASSGVGIAGERPIPRAPPPGLRRALLRSRAEAALRVLDPIAQLSHPTALPGEQEAFTLPPPPAPDPRTPPALAMYRARGAETSLTDMISPASTGSAGDRA